MKLSSVFLVFISITILLSGCTFKLKTKEIESEEYESAGNELSLFGFGIGESIPTIRDILNEKGTRDHRLYSFPENEVEVFARYNLSEFLVTTNQEFRVLDDIKIGMSKDELISEYNDLELFEQKHKSEPISFIFFSIGAQKVALELNDNVIKKIIIGTKEIPFIQMMNYKESFESDDELLSDDEIIADSTFLTFSIDLIENKERLLSPNFLKYAKMGLIEGIPVPIGMNKTELVNRFGYPDYVFPGEKASDVYYFYNRFNVYMGFGEDEVLQEIKLPASVPVKTFKEVHEITSSLNETDLSGGYSILFRQNNEQIMEVVIRKE